MQEPTQESIESNEPNSLEALESVQSPLKKMLSSGLPAQKYQHFLNQPADQVDVALCAELELGEQLNFSLTTWKTLLSNDNFLTAVTENNILRKHVLQNIVLRAIEGESIHIFFEGSGSFPDSDASKILANLCDFKQKATESFTRYRFAETIFEDMADFLLLQDPRKFADWVINFKREEVSYVSPLALKNLYKSRLLESFSAEQIRALKIKFQHYDKEYINKQLDWRERDTFKEDPCKVFVIEVTESEVAQKLSCVTLEDAQKHFDLLTNNKASMETSELVRLAHEHRSIAEQIVSHPELMTKLHIDQICNTAKSHIIFAVRVFEKLAELPETCIPANHVIRVIDKMSTHELNDIMKSAKDLTEEKILWSVARLFKAGFDGNVWILHDFAEMFAKGHLVERNPLLAHTLHVIAAQHGHLPSVIKAANNYFTGNGAPANRIIAFEFYQFIAQTYPDHLDETLMQRFASCQLLKARTTYDAFNQLKEQCINMDEQAKLPKLPTAFMGKLSSSLCASQATFFKSHRVCPMEQQLEAVTEQLQEHAERLINMLEPITSMDLTAAGREKFALVPAVQHAHALNLQMLIEHKELIEDKEAWKASFLNSLEIAWDYDQLPNGDRLLAQFINSIKQMHNDDSYRDEVEAIAAQKAKKTEPQEQPGLEGSKMTM